MKVSRAGWQTRVEREFRTWNLSRPNGWIISHTHLFAARHELFSSVVRDERRRLASATRLWSTRLSRERTMTGQSPNQFKVLIRCSLVLLSLGLSAAQPVQHAYPSANYTPGHPKSPFRSPIGQNLLEIV